MQDCSLQLVIHSISLVPSEALITQLVIGGGDKRLVEDNNKVSFTRVHLVRIKKNQMNISM